MTQVYRFTDANGEVRLMAEIDPAPGGSLPAQWTVGANGELEITPGVDATVLRLASFGNQFEPTFEVLYPNGDPLFQAGGDVSHSGVQSGLTLFGKGSDLMVALQVYDTETGTSVFSFDSNGVGQLALSGDATQLLSLYPTATSAEWHKLIKGFGPSLSDIVFFVGAHGHFGTAANAALDNVNMIPGSMAFWFDKVAAKMMVQARLDDDTMVTGELALTP